MERNLRLDCLKIILSILVITVHIQPLFEENSLLGWLISNGIARIAVPCFFVISGYFIQPKIEDYKNLRRYILHLLSVYIIWSIIYLPIYYSSIEPRSLITFAFMGFYHLWFLPALIVAIIVLALITKFIKKDIFILFSGIVLFITGYIMEISGLPYRSFCNGLFFGYPFVAIGYLLYKRNILSRIKYSVLYSTLTISLLTLLLESYLGYKEYIYHNLFLSLFILSPGLVIWGLKGIKRGILNDYIYKLPAGIYYVHILVLTLIIPLSETDNIINLPFIAIVSILLSIFITFINKQLKIIYRF